MRTLSRTGLALGAALLLTAPTLAQVRVQPAQPIQPDAARLIAVNPNNPQLVLLGLKAVQEDLKLTDAQVKAVADLNQKQQEALKAPNPRDRLAKIREVTEVIKKGLAEALKPEQTRRLQQLQIQQRGATAFFDPQVSRDLGLNNDQQLQIRQAIQESSKKRTEIVRDNRGNPDALRQKLADLDRGTVEGIVKGLTDEQRTKWKDVAGEPFKGALPGAAQPGGIIRPFPQPRELPPGVLPVPPGNAPPPILSQPRREER